jgi:pyrroloquinoline quinone biosynthesis protein B
LNASPDLRFQIEATPELQPSPKPGDDRLRSSPIAAALLTSSDIDNILGLLLLREFQPLDIYATRSIRHILTQENSMFRALQRVSPQAVWRDIVPDESFNLGASDRQESAPRCEPIPLPGGYPEYIAHEERAMRRAAEAVVGLEIQTAPGGRKMIYCPALPEISDSLLARFAACDLLLLDGTFWSDDELIRVRGAGRTALQMGHVPISGHEGSLQWLRAVTRPAKVYIHINNTNPILDEDSDEFMQVTAAGWSVARDGMRVTL